jgi:hypothetical protein
VKSPALWGTDEWMQNAFGDASSKISIERRHGGSERIPRSRDHQAIAGGRFSTARAPNIGREPPGMGQQQRWDCAEPGAEAIDRERHHCQNLLFELPAAVQAH